MKRLFNKMFLGGGVRSFLPLMMLIVCSILGTTDAWAGHGGPHYGKVTVAKTGSGLVYVGTTNTATYGNSSESWKCSDQNDNDSKTYYLFATPDAANHYYFEGWYLDGANKGTASPYTATHSASSTTQNSPTTFAYTAKFEFLPKFYFAAGAEVDAAGNGTGKVAVAYSSTEPAAGNFSADPVSAKTDVWATAITDGSKTATAYYFAKADAGMTFMGWYDEDGVQKTTNTTYSVQQTSTTKADDATPEVYYARFRDPSIKFEPSVELAGQDGATEVTIKVDDEQNVSFVNVDDAVLSTLNAPTITEVSRVDVGSDPIVVWNAANRKLTANRAGTATVTFSHPVTDGFNAGNFTFTIHVEKITPEFSWKTSVLLAGQSYTLTDLVETPSDGAWNIVSSKESVIASISQAGTQSATANIGTVTLTFSQGLSYKYNAIPAASQEFKVYTNEGFATYLVNGKTYTDLGVAASEASKLSKNKYVVVATDGTVVPGNYTIPAGVTLIIPYTENSTTEKKILSSAAYNIVVNRTLTLVEGVNIKVEGTIIVAAELQSGDASHNPCGFPVGGVGVLDMSKGGHIDVEKDGKLLAWGFVKGQGMLDGNNTKNVGTITAKDGSLIRECYGVVDWGGGSLTVALQGAQSQMRIYPFQGYYVQNIEVPVRFEYGAKEQLYTNVYGNKSQNAADEIYFIGSQSGVLFRVMSNKGAVTKWYDATTDHMVVELEGDAKLDNLKIVVMGYTINANDYDLPILSNMHIKLKDCNLTLASPIVLQPSAIFEITKGSSLTLSTNMFVYDVDQWEKIVMGKYFKPLPVVPTPHFTRGDGNSKDMMEDAKLIVDGTMTIDANGILYTTAGGGNVMGNGGGTLSWGRTVPGSKNVCGYTGGTSVNGSNFSSSLKDEYKVTNPCDPARLHNDNDSYTASLSNTTFDNIHGRWFKRADAKERDDDHTYNFTYINGDNTAATAKSVYSADKTGLTAGYKWVNVTTDSEHANTFLGEDGNLYNWTTNSEWLQLVATGDGTYAGSDDNLYTYADGAWHKGTITMGDDCLYDFEGTKKALVGKEFIAITHDEYDEVFVDASGNYYMLFDGCVWQHAEKVPNTYKAYVVLGNYYVWIDNAWTEVGKENDLFYTTDDQNLKHYYEYDGAIFAWVPVQNKVRISNAAGEEREFRTWDDAMLYTSQYNDPTITLLGDVEFTKPYTLTVNAKTTNLTLDLNDYVVSANIGAEVYALKLNNSKLTLTVTDNSDRQRGELKVTCSVAKRVDAINVTLGKVVMEAGKVSIHNTSTSTSGNAAAIYAAAGQSVTMNGGELNAMSTRYPYGIYGASSAALASTSIVTMNGGTINATSKDYAYGIYSYGIINMNGGTINATTTVVNGVAASSYAYGIYASASPNATEANAYRSVLTMKGGTINSNSGNQYAYGVYAHAAVTTCTTAMDGTYSNKAAAHMDISGGTINVTAVGANAYAVNPYGCFNSNTDRTEANQVPHTIKNVTINAKGNSNAYGILVSATIADYSAGILYGNVIVDNVNIHAETTGSTTAYGVYVSAAGKWLNRASYHNITAANRKTWYVPAGNAGDGDLTHEAINGTDANTYKYQIGNYTCGAKCVVNGGTFYAKSVSTTAAGIYVHGAASPGDNSWGFGELTINGGTFTGETGTDTGMGIYNLGNTTINGGTFSAITGTTTAYGAYGVTGTLNLKGGTYNATSNGSTAYGVAAGATISTGNTTRGHGTVNVYDGVVVKARSLTSSTAFGAYAAASAQELTEAKYDARSTSDRGQYCLVDAEGNLLKEALNATTNDGAKANFYKYQIGRYFEGGIVNIYGGTFNATANTSTAAGVAAHMSNIVRTTEVGRFGTARGTVNVYDGTFNVECETSSTAMGVRSYGIVNVEGGTFNMTPKTTNAEGVRVCDGTATINGGTFNINATTNAAYGVFTTPDWDTNYAFGYSGEIIVNGGTFNVKTYGGDNAYAAYSTGGTKNMKGAKVTGDVAKDYAVAGSITINGGEFTMTPSTGKNAYGMVVAAPYTLNAAKAYSRGTINGGFFKMVGTSSIAATGSSAVEDGEGVPQLQVKGGHFSTKANLEKAAPSNYVRDPYHIIACVEPEYKATYPFEVAEVYTITFKNDAGVTLWTGFQPKGTMAVYPLTNGVPEKTATADNSFEFAGWNNPLAEVTEDATYTASFNAVAKKYMVTWQDETGKEIDHLEWASGQTPTHADPVKEGYTFTGWTPSITAVAGAAQTYKATFKINTFTIRFEDEDGTLLKEQVVNYGVKPTAPANPTKDGYSFSKWNPGVLPATENVTYTASYLLDIASVTTSAGKTTKYSTFAAALKAANAAENSILVLLQDQVGLGAQTITQTFTLDLNGHTLASATSKFITLSTAGKTLTIDDSKGGGRIEMIGNAAAEMSAVFVSAGTVQLNAGSVYCENVYATANDSYRGEAIRVDAAAGKFVMNGGRAEGRSKNCGYGIYAAGPVEVYGGEVVGVTRTKARAIYTKGASLIVKNAYLEATTTVSTGAYGIYSDTGTPVFTIDNVTIKATAATTDAYGINLYSGNKGTISNVKIQATTAPIDADATNALSITSGFFDKETNLAKYIGTKKLVALATEPEKAEGYNYKIVDAAYQVTFLAEDGTELQQGNVEKGVQPVFMREEPTKPSNPKTSYEFAGWSDGVRTYTAAEIPVANAAATYTAVFIEHGVEYPITFYKIDGKNGTYVQMVEYGTVPVYDGPAPYQLGDVDNAAYIFNGWTPALVEVTEPTTYEATFRLEIAVDVTFHANGRGTDPVALKIAKGAAIGCPPDQLVDCQHIVGWYTEPGCINEWNFASDLVDETDIDLYAKWATKTYTITWLDEFGDEIDQTVVDCGVAPTHEKLYKPSTASYSYEFLGWNKTLVAANADATYKSLGFNQVAKRYAITFNTNGGTAIAPIEQEVGSAVTAPADPTREGYRFLGWTPAIPATMPAGDMTITAQWQNLLQVIYNANGHGTAPASLEVVAGQKLTEPTAPTATGYTFGGWYQDQACTEAKKWNFSSMLMGDASMTLYAKWTPKTYTISYNANYEDAASISETKSVTYDAQVGALRAMSDRDSHTFLGWYDAAEGGNKYTTTTMYTTDGNKTLYAHWQIKSYTITWKDGNGATLKTTSVNHGVVPSYDGVTPTKTTDAAYSYTWNRGWTPVPYAANKAETYTATFEGTANVYHVTYNMLGHGTAPAQGNVAYDALVTAPATPQATGYAFGGWYKDEDCTTAWNFVSDKMPARDLVLYAKWTINQYTISFNMNGAESGQVDPIAQDYNTPVTAPATTPEKTGYTFAGWSPDVPTTMPASNTQCVAQWTENQYIIELNTNGHGASTMINNVRYTANQSLSSYKPVNKGYAFLGWATAADGEVVYAEDASVSRLSATNGATVTLYAKWSENRYSIEFNANGATGEMAGIADVPYAHEQQLTKNAFTMTGYHFANWQIERENVGGASAPARAAAAEYDYYADEAMVSKLRSTDGAMATMVAQWEENTYTIAFNANGGSGSMTALTGVRYSESKVLTANTFEREGYTFAGWALTASGAKAYNDGASVRHLTAENDVTVTLYAKWTPNKYTYMFYDADGTTELGKKTQDYESSLSAITTPSKYGYVFQSWTPAVPTKMPLHGGSSNAVWTKGQYAVTFVVEGAQLQHSLVEYEAQVTYAGATPEKDKTTANTYTFRAWKSSKDNHEYTTDHLPAMGGEAVTYTAMFDEHVRQYHISVLSADETMGYTTGTGDYDYNSTQTITAVANEKYKFVRWEDEDEDAESVGASRQISVISAAEYTAIFKLNNITVENEIVEETETLVIEAGQTMTVTNDLTIEADGAVEIGEEGKLVVRRNLIIRANEGSNMSESVSQYGQSGIMDVNMNQVTIIGSAYFDLKLTCWSEHPDDPSYSWHAFSVPFPVDLTVADAVLGDNIWRGNTKQTTAAWSNLVFGKNYSIQEYDAVARAAGNTRTWKTIDKTSTLQPGKFYLMTVDGYSERIRFKKTGGDFTTSNEVTVTQYSSSVGKNANWNGLGNPSLGYRWADVNVVSVLDPVNYMFKTVAANTLMLATGAGFFVQAEDNASSIEMTSSVPSPVAARAMSNARTFIAAHIASDSYSDNLYLEASDDAQTTYQLGHDLTKMHIDGNTSLPQIAATAYGTELSVMSTPWMNDQAVFPLSLYAPKDGTYTISVEETGETVYLLCNGALVANLSLGAYELDLTQGSTADYSIVISRRRVATDLDGAQGATEANVKKIIFNDKVYILRDNKLFSVTGKMVK